MNRDDKGGRQDRQDKGYESKTVSIRRVAKVTPGGKRLRFSAMVVVGDRKGSVGVALGRGVDTRSAIEKGERRAKKAMKKIQVVGDTIPHEIFHKNGASKVMLRPARPGTGVIAGSSVRTVLDLCGIENVYGKVLGSNDLVANAYTTFEALMELRSARVLKKMKNMQDRIHLKEQLDIERKEREVRRKKRRDEAVGSSNDKKNTDRRPRGRKFTPRDKASETKADVKPAESAKEETKSDSKK